MIPASDRKRLDGTATGLTVLLCVVWGLQQIFIKAAAPDMSPTMQIALRSGFAALLIVPLLRARGYGLLPANGAWKAGAMAGFLYALEYLLLGEGLRFTSASHSVVFLYTAPAFAALGLHWLLPEERLTAVQWAGMALAFAGIAVTFYGRSPLDADFRTVLFGDFLALLAGAAWGATTVVIRCTKLAQVPPMQTVFCLLAAAFVLLLPAAALLGQAGFRLTSVVWTSLAFNIVIMSFASQLAWLWLLRHYLASRLGALLFLTPLFGVAFGVALLDETVAPRFILGAAMVLTGILLVSARQALATLQPRKNRPS